MDDGLNGLRRQLMEYLASRGGRCTRRQWIGETCLLKRAIADQLTTELVRKTKRHCIARNILARVRESGG